MTVSTISESQYKAARVAAVLYLLMVLTAPFALIYAFGELPFTSGFGSGV